MVEKKQSTEKSAQNGSQSTRENMLISDDADVLLGEAKPEKSEPLQEKNKSLPEKVGVNIVHEDTGVVEKKERKTPKSISAETVHKKAGPAKPKTSGSSRNKSNNKSTKSQAGAKSATPAARTKGPARGTTPKQKKVITDIKTKKATQKQSATKTKSSNKTSVSKISANKKDVAAPKLWKFVLQKFGVILGLAATSILFAVYFVWRTNYGSWDTTWEFIGKHVGILFFNAALIFCLLTFLASALWRPFLATSIVFVILTIIGFANEQKYIIRASPIFPEEVSLVGNAGELLSFVEIGEIIRVALLIVGVLAVGWLIDFLIRRALRKKRKLTPKKWRVIPRIIVPLLSVGAFIALIVPVMAKSAPLFAGDIEYITWDRTTNYQENGFVVGFLHAIAPTDNLANIDYSQETIKEIQKTYQAKKERDMGRVPLSDVVDNFIIILDESFADPEIFLKYYEHAGEDVVPNLHRIMQQYPSGYMFTHEYGGGTGNVEFEVETGLTNYWYKGIPYSTSVANMDQQLSAASWAKESGFATTAIHSYLSTMYERYRVYPVIGMDNSIFEDSFTYQWKENYSKYINDQALYQEALDVLKSSSSPQFLALTTMQNHSPYDSAKYPRLHYYITAKEKERGEFTRTNNSWESMHKADEYLGEFIDALDELDERTVVLWFGDHTPGVIDRFIKSDDRNDQLTAHLVPYFMYANFDIESPYTAEDTAKQREELEITIEAAEDILETINLPLVTPNCLLNQTYDLLWVKKPAISYLTAEVCQEMPIFSAAYWGSMQPEETLVFSAYKLATYDRLSGERYWDGQ